MKSVDILIVDDESFVSESLVIKIGKLNHGVQYSCTTAQSAAEGLSNVERNKYDIIFTDIRMPIVSGPSFIKRLREQGYKGYLIAVSGHDNFEYVREAFIQGADDYMLKPVAISALDEKLRALFESGIVKPSEKSGVSHDNIVQHAIEYMEKHYVNSSLDMTSVAEHVSLSYGRFSHVFKKETGLSFPNYLMRLRVKKAIMLLSDASIKVYEIAQMVGFKHSQQFSRDFKKITGVYPSDYRTNKENDDYES